MNINMYRIFFKIQQKHWWFVTKKEIVMDVIERYSNKLSLTPILDIGCGSGLMLKDLAELGETCGMDMSDDAIKFSKEIYNGEIKKGALPDNLPYEKYYFNLIVALDVIEHIDDDLASLKAMRSRLKKNGMALITVPAYMFLWSAFDEMNEHKRRYTMSELREKIIEAGFEIEKISYFNTLLFPLVYIVRKLNNLMGRNGGSDVDMPNKLVNYICKKIFSIERYLLRMVSLPFGVSLIVVARNKS